MSKKEIYENARVLLVEDNQVNLFVLYKLFEQMGISADKAASGKECIKKVSKRDYDIIFMDHLMPDMDGVQTLKKLKDDYEIEFPVVVMTTEYHEDLEQIYTEAGFAEYILKPVDQEVLEKMVERYLLNDLGTKKDLGLL